MPDTVERQLVRLAAAGERLAQLPEPAELVAQARRRRRARAALTALSLVLLAVLAVQGRSLLDRNEPDVVPVAPPPSPTTRAVPATTLPGVTTSASTTSAPPTRTRPAGLRFSVAPSTVRPGQRVVLAGSGCPARAQVHLAWTAAVDPVNVAEIGTITARADGTFRTTWVVGASWQPGTIRISAACGQPASIGTAILKVTGS
jgi:hypothetical protein